MTSFAKSIKLAVLTDIHYGPPSILPQRRSEIADILLMRTVHRLNRLVQPDAVVVLGDVLNDDTVPDAAELLAHMRTILDKLHAPYIAIPGNHDGDVDNFYRVLDRPAESVDIATRNGNIRFLPFIDPEAPGYNATRNDTDIARFRPRAATTTGQSWRCSTFVSRRRASRIFRTITSTRRRLSMRWQNRESRFPLVGIITRVRRL